MPLVGNLLDAFKNIRRYQTEVQDDGSVARELVRRMAGVKAWYAVKSRDGESWLFGPSEFIGYEGVPAEIYLTQDVSLNGRETERHLQNQRWSVDVLPHEGLAAELHEALREFLERYRSHPNEDARVRVLKMPFVNNRLDTIKNIRRYQAEVQDDGPVARELVRRMASVRAWYAVKSRDGKSWLFGPSKFIGYEDITAETYLTKGVGLNGGETERHLQNQRWSGDVLPHEGLAAELHEALREFLERYRSHPNEDARVRVLMEDPAAQGVGSEEQDRIHIDPAVCGGRPHVRDTRVRVSDILDMLASGVSSSDILADYPCLKEADLRAALAFGAAASAHRIIPAA